LPKISLDVFNLNLVRKAFSSFFSKENRFMFFKGNINNNIINDKSDDNLKRSNVLFTEKKKKFFFFFQEVKLVVVQ
jgi:hypothetical protein